MEREAEEKRATRYRAMYEDLNLRAVAHPDGTLEASWRFGEAVLRNSSDYVQEQTRHEAPPRERAPDRPIVSAGRKLAPVLRG
jgi:hypothetical protein